MVSVEYMLGILFSIFATICFNLSPILQKEALNEMESVKFSKMTKSLKDMILNKKWLLGLLVYLIGVFPYILAMNWVGMAVVQPITNLGIIVLIIFGRVRLNERLNIYGKIGIGMMIIMPFFIAFAGVSNVQRELSDLTARLALVGITGLIIIVVIVSSIVSKKIPIFLTCSVGLLFSLVSFYMQSYTSMIRQSGYDILEDLDLILLNAFSDPNIRVANMYFILLLVFSGIAGFTLQIGLQKIPASNFNPIQQTINNLISILSGLLIFNQSVTNWLFYGLGISCALLGTFLLGKHEIIKPITDIEDKTI